MSGTAVAPVVEPAAFEGLDRTKYVLLTTFRVSGEGVPTPVWFADDGGTLYIKTGVDSGKVKRLRRRARVEVAPCTLRGRPLGDGMPAAARVVVDAAEEERAERALAGRYGLVRRAFLAALHLFGVRELYVAVEPV